jgi:hypothetical protein
LMAKASDSVMRDLPTSLRRIVRGLTPIIRASRDWPPVPRSLLSESQKHEGHPGLCPGLRRRTGATRVLF